MPMKPWELTFFTAAPSGAEEATPPQPHLDWQARASMIRRMDEDDFDWDELGGKWERHAFRCLLDLIAAEKEIERLKTGAALPVPEPPLVTIRGEDVILQHGQYVVQIREENEDDAKFVADVLQKLLASIKAVPEPCPETPSWIPLTQELPELDKTVLCYGQGLKWIAIRRGHFLPDGDKGYFESEWESGKGSEMLPFDMFTHWMPLPNPPAGELKDRGEQ